MKGTVTSFDAGVGLGEITDAEGVVVAFHCIAIADGSRLVDIGATVEFDWLAKLGRYEATSIRPI